MSNNNENKLIPRLRFPEFEHSGEWEVKKLGEVGEIVTGSTPSKNDPDNWNGSFVWVTAQDFTKKYITDSKVKLTDKGKSKCRIIPENSVLVTCIASIGLNAINKVECATNQQINAVVCYEEFYCFEFIYYSIVNNETRLKNIAGKTAVPIVNKSNFEGFSIPFPSLPEQQKIAACLSSLDELITAERQKLEVLKQHKKGLLQNLFPQEGETLPRLRFPEFKDSGEWEVKRVDEYFNVGSSKRVLQKDWKSQGIPFYRTRELVSLSRGELFKSEVFISEELYEKLKNEYGVPKEGDFLVSGVGTLGVCYLVKRNDKFYFKDGNVIWFSILDGVDANYFKYCFLSDNFQNQIFSQVSKSTVGTYTIQNAKKTRFWKPPLMKEQQKIASCLSSLDDVITAQTQKIELLEQHKKGLLQGLFPNVHDGDNG
jgi:type I restriction enzyme S subunit